MYPLSMFISDQCCGFMIVVFIYFNGVFKVFKVRISGLGCLGLIWVLISGGVLRSIWASFTTHLI